MRDNRQSSKGRVFLFIFVALLSPFLVFNKGLAAEESVLLRTQIILASNEPGKGVDPQLSALAHQLRSVFGYTSYQLISSPGGSLVPGKPWRTPLPENRALEVVLIDREKGFSRLGVKIFDGGRALLDTKLRLRMGGTVLLGGPSYREGVLIIALSVRGG